LCANIFIKRIVIAQVAYHVALS